MIVCPACGQETPKGFPRCANCGAPLEAAPEARREERKVVTVLFCDLVGFTSRAERLDPEEVRALQAPYLARVRSELERHGGTVEKFIGDAVMALFGAPQSHEDDPERAVRAALAIRDGLEDELQVRIGITTGEALVSLGARPAEGEGMASGDVVNTAARLQAAAAENGILVDETTYRATERAISYRDADAVVAKGKAEPVPVWEALEARSRFGLEASQPGAPLVGRRRELDRLSEALTTARAERTAQLVTLVGVPGIGKSRLVYELGQIVEQDPDFITWRQGRSLPYGEGVTFWALSEMVKAEAGILESDSSSEADAKLRLAVAGVIADTGEAAWVEARLKPLVGLEAEVSADRAESFAAWRRFLEGLAEQRPTVLVFEDLHWADDDVLDFVDHLAEWVRDVPLLLVCTARPELLERRPGWGGGKPNASTISLAPLSDEETARLIGTLMPAEQQEVLLERAGGNPLYAEQFARMLAERGHGGDLSLPETVQGIIAARLDGIPPGEKTLLQDASVLGKVFWLGALAHMERSARAALEERLHGLERKEFLRRERRPSIAGEQEYAFRHLLVRDVAYGQIPRGERAAKHRRAAEWIESLSADRSEDRADLLAHHYSSALDFARAAGLDAAGLEEPARTALREAGDRAYALHSHGPARKHYGRALELSGPEDEHRPVMLARCGQMMLADGEDGFGLLDEAISGFLARDDRDSAALAELEIASGWWWKGGRDASFAALDRALELVADLPDSRTKARVLNYRGRVGYIAGDDEGVELARAGLQMAERLGLDDAASHAWTTIGMARATEGDAGGIADLERGVELAKNVNDPQLIHTAYNNLVQVLWGNGELQRASETLAQLRAADERFGIPSLLRWLEAEEVFALWVRGDWSEALRRADAFIASCAESPHYQEMMCRLLRARMRLAHGDRAGALEDSRVALERAGEQADPQVVLPALLVRVEVLSATGSQREAETLLDEALGHPSIGGFVREEWMVQLAPLLAALGRSEEYLALVEGFAPTPWLDAGIAVASGDWSRAAEILDGIGAIADAARIRLRAEGEEHLRRALDFYRSVDATAYVREGEALLAATA